jgi:hypothetical protein
MLRRMNDLAAHMRQRLERDDVEHVDEQTRFVEILSFDARFGVACDADGENVAWARQVEPGAALVRFTPTAAKHFVELLEQPRRGLDEQIEAAAHKLGMPVDPLLLSLPSVELVRAMLKSGSPHYCRVALQWLVPTELRELRDDIAPLVDDRNLPIMVRELAEHLLVPI